MAGRSEPVRVTIFNQSYSLVANGAGGQDAGQVQALAARVDDLMHSIARQAGNIDAARTAVLACLHLADQLQAVEAELAELRSRVDSKARAFTLLLDDAIAVAHSAGGEFNGE